jgi:hypothetical protein
LRPELPKINPVYIIITLSGTKNNYIKLSEEKVIADIITNILREKEKISLENLTKSLNRMKIYYPLVKPFELETIKKILLNNPKKFAFNDSSGIVELTDDLSIVINSLKRNKIKITELSQINLEEDVEILVAIRFTGKKFILTEAEEYVKTRPIICIFTISKYDLYVFDTLEIYLSKEFAEIIDSLFESDKHSEDWMLNNLSASYYYEYCQFSQREIFQKKLFSN